MFGIGMGEMALIAVAAIVILGPERCIELFRKAGRLWRTVQTEMAKAKREFDHSGVTRSSDEKPFSPNLRKNDPSAKPS